MSLQETQAGEVDEMPHEIEDYLRLSRHEAERQWRGILARRPVGPGQNQVDYVPVETLLCAAAMLAIGHASYGSGLAAKGPHPIPELAALFRRRPTSITSKMANLDGGRSRGGKSDMQLWTVLSADHHQLFDLYRVVVAAARVVGVGPEALPDFLGIEASDSFALLGQDELDDSALETALREAGEQYAAVRPDERPSEREIIGWARIGQHRFARAVLDNCGWQCVFCGFSLSEGPTRTLLRASHIKAWRASNDGERRDLRNGVAACPTHDAAFDVGDLSLSDDLSIVLSSRAATTTNPAARIVFDPPLLRRLATLPDGHPQPRRDYVHWHRVEVFTG